MWFRRTTAEAQLDKELRYHFEKLVRDSIAAGIDRSGSAPPSRSWSSADVEQIKEECRDVRGRWFEDLGKDLHYAARTLRRSPGFLLVSVLSLALGIGANTAIFSLINAVMLRPLPVREPQRLVQITRLRANGKPGVVSYPLFEYFRDNLKSISGAAVELASGSDDRDGRSRRKTVSTELVSGAHYALLGLEPAAGRLLEPGDDAISPAAPAAVISYRYWQRRFGLNAAALGKTFTLSGQAVHDRRCHSAALTREPARGAIRTSPCRSR